MEKKFEIEKLDEGFIFKADNKSIAFEELEGIYSKFKKGIESMLLDFKNWGIKDAEVKITFNYRRYDSAPKPPDFLLPPTEEEKSF